jgi:hypothetical protein
MLLFKVTKLYDPHLILSYKPTSHGIMIAWRRGRGNSILDCGLEGKSRGKFQTKIGVLDISDAREITRNVDIMRRCNGKDAF